MKNPIATTSKAPPSKAPPKLKLVEGRLEQDFSGEIDNLASWAKALTEGFNTEHLDWALSQVDLLVSSFGNKIKPDDIDHINGLIATIVAMRPSDPLELQLVTQLSVLHHQAMSMIASANRSSRLSCTSHEDLKMANLLWKTHSRCLSELIKYRKRGQQHIVVEHISIEAGSQAVIGSTINGRG